LNSLNSAFTQSSFSLSVKFRILKYFEFKYVNQNPQPTYLHFRIWIQSKTQIFGRRRRLYLKTGSVCKLPKLIQIKNEYKVRIFVGDSYALDVLGKSGRGAYEHFNILELLSTFINADLLISQSQTINS